MGDKEHFNRLCVQLVWHLVCYHRCACDDDQTLACYYEGLVVNEYTWYRVLKKLSAEEAILDALRGFNMSDEQKYYTVLYCRNGDTTPMVDDCSVMGGFNDRYVMSMCEKYSSDFVIVTEYEGLEPSFNTVYDYVPAKLTRSNRIKYGEHYVPRGTDYAAL